MKKIVRVNPKRMSLSMDKGTHPKKVPLHIEKKSTYEKDFYFWTKNQAAFMRAGELSKLDIDHLIEEIESLGRSEENALESHLTILFLHLLKIRYQPEKSCASWEGSIDNAKYRINRLIQKNPSLKNVINDLVDSAYYSSRILASNETGIDRKKFPEKCPWTIKELFSSFKLKKSQ